MNKYHFVKNLVLALFLFFVTTTANAVVGLITYKAKIVKTDGTLLENASVNFKLSVLNPAKTCTLYSETFSLVNMTGSAGNIALTLGTGIKVFPTTAKTLSDIFANGLSLACEQGTTYLGASTDSRILVMQFNDGESSTWNTTPPMAVNSSPYAFYATKADSATSATTATTANNSLLFDSLAKTSFVLKTDLASCTAGQALFYSGTAFSCVSVSGGGGGASGTTGVVSVASGNSYITASTTASAVTVTANVGTAVNTLAAGNDSRITGALQASNNLSDLASTSTARTNLGVGSASVLNITGMTGNALIMTDSGGTALVNKTCLTGEMLQWSGSGWVCSSISQIASSTTFSQGGNSFGAGATLGTNDANSLALKTNNATQMTISSAGDIGVGVTPTTTSKLKVQGAASSVSNIIATGATVNLALSNSHLLKAPGGSALTLQNPSDGATYTLFVSDTTARTYTFVGCTNQYFSPANGPTTYRSAYTISVIVDGANTDCYITWMTGFN